MFMYYSPRSDIIDIGYFIEYILILSYKEEVS